MNVWKIFEIAKKIAQAHDDERDFHLGAVGIRDDGIFVGSCNGSVVMDTNDRRGYFSKCHAETRLCRKLDKNSVVFVVRVSGVNEDYRNAKPCQTCQNALRKRGVLKVYYTISNNTFGVIHFR